MTRLADAITTRPAIEFLRHLRVLPYICRDRLVRRYLPMFMTQPDCPRCRSPRVEEQDQNGSSQRWFDCCNCGHRWAQSAREVAAPRTERQPFRPERVR